MIFLFSCNTTKKLHKGEYLLSSTRIIYKFGSAQKVKGLNNITDIGKEGIEKFEIPQRIAPFAILPYVKQKPNTKILAVLPFYLYLYNLPDSANTARAKIARDMKDSIKAIKKGWSKEKLKRKTERKTGREWIMSQGEAPVILDSSLTQKSTEQIKNFLFNKGYFNATVKDSVHIHGKKAEVFYTIKQGKPYKIRQIDYYFEDPALAAEIFADSSNCKIRRNDLFDQDALDAERDRITAELNNAGYYYFSKQYVSYELDTNSRTHLIDLTINIKKFAERDPYNKDSTIYTAHEWYRIRRVTVQMNYDPTVAIYHPDDTLLYDGLIVVYPKGPLCLKPKIFRPKIFVTPGDVYRIVNREDTYTGLSQLDEFTYVQVKYAPIKDSNYVDCYIQLLPRVKHSFGAEFEFTNTGGDGGVQGDVSYGNYNQFNGAEKLSFKLNGGLIAEQVLASKTQNISKYVPLNTIDIGPELDLAVPRPLFPFSLFHFARRVNPQTSIKLSYDYQQRPDYLRHVFGLSYAFDWNPVKNQHFTVAPIEINLVNANLSPSFAQELLAYNLVFQNSFKTQFITDLRVSWLLNTQSTTGRQNRFDYLKLSVEPSGLVFYPVVPWGLWKLPVDASSGSYYINGLPPFSQYIKGDLEWRHYIILDKKQKLVTRTLIGAGLPYDNSSELPFTKSFWAGGSNDIRAWQMQTLGPGSSTSSDVAGQIGEFKLEENFEYRVSLIKYFGIALFADAGNIWLWNNKINQIIRTLLYTPIRQMVHLPLMPV